MLSRDPQTKRLTHAGAVSLLQALSARAPSEGEEMALRALARGHANESQQKTAFRYILELCGVGALVFDPASERATAFRLGSQTLAQALSVIAGAAWVSFRNEPDAQTFEDEAE